MSFLYGDIYYEATTLFATAFGIFYYESIRCTFGCTLFDVYLYLYIRLMKYAIISDIHSNLEALTKALEIIDQRTADEIICLGDIVGYGANPNECIALIRQRCSIVIKGNHDEALLNKSITERFTEDARSAIEWTSKQISEEHISYLRTLSLSMEKEGILFVHASPCFPEHWKYIIEDKAAAKAFQCFSQSLCFIGHTHAPAIFSAAGRVTSIKKDERYLINVGSVGQPRDRTTDLSFGIFDTDKWTYENIRSSYNVELTVQKILATDLPIFLGYRLLTGQ
jgi:predicted phosphodiesterase